MSENLEDKISTTDNPFAISFGEPESALTESYADYNGLFMANSGWYVPPISINGLIKLMRVNGTHGRMPSFVSDMLLKYMQPNPLINRQTLKRACIDHQATANGYLWLRHNTSGVVVEAQHLPTSNMVALPERRDRFSNGYAYIKNGEIQRKFTRAEIFHITDYSPDQRVYGIPRWYGMFHSILLNEDSKLFRRKYYRNGSHAGYILVTTDPSLKEADEIAIKKSIQKSKGAGNFRSIYLNFPKANIKASDVVNLIPVGDIATKDEFRHIQQLTTADILNGWGIRGELAGITPTANGSTGDLNTLNEINHANITVPYQQDIQIINERLPKAAHIKFNEP